jgi:thermitase
MVWIYSISYFVSLAGLMGWFYFKGTSKSPLASKIFLGAYLIYIICLAFAPGGLTYKLMVLGRDVVVMAAVIAGFQYLKQKAWMLIVGLLVFAALVPLAFPMWLQTFPSADYEVPFTVTDEKDDDEGEFLIRFKDGESPISILSFNEDYSVEWMQPFKMQSPEKTGLDNWWLLNIMPSAEMHLDEIYERLSKKESIEELEWNDKIELSPIMTDAPPATDRNTYFNDPLSASQWYIEMTGIYEAHQWLEEHNIRPAKKARIAILDTGIESEHEDIHTHYQSFQAGSDSDPHGHGTHCAGLAAAVSNNGLGIAGIPPSDAWISVGSVRVLNSFGGGTQRGIIQGILDAADGGADVISLSLGGRSSDSKQRAYEKAVKYANEHGAIVVVAAGNESTDARNIAPANAKGVIAVAAVNQDGRKAPFSNTITNLEMGIAAPGVDMLSTIPSNRYLSFNGTSMATPQVAGLIAMLKSIKPEITSREALDIISSTGTAGVDSLQTGNIINVKEAIKALTLPALN